MSISHDLRSLANPEKAKFLQRYFKTGPGEYAEGDIFLGLTVPQARAVARKYKSLPLADVKQLLLSKYHEERQAALMILADQFQKADELTRKNIYNFYLSHTRYINHWGLIDGSAPLIVGAYLVDKNKAILYKLAKSKDLWQRRIAVLATFWFIKNDQFDETLKIAEMLLDDKHDLIHKAVGWMLREIGKKNKKIEEEFLTEHCRKMPRTMLRYAIEKFSESERKKYLDHTKMFAKR